MLPPSHRRRRAPRKNARPAAVQRPEVAPPWLAAHQCSRSHRQRSMVHPHRIGWNGAGAHQVAVQIQLHLANGDIVPCIHLDNDRILPISGLEGAIFVALLLVLMEHGQIGAGNGNLTVGAWLSTITGSLSYACCRHRSQPVAACTFHRARWYPTCRGRCCRSGHRTRR